MDQEKWYTPNNKVSGRTVLFDAEAAKEKKFAPWEVKDSAIKHSFIGFVVYMWDWAFNMGALTTIAQSVVVANCTRSIFGFMLNAVTKVTLLDGGKQVEFTFGKTTGKSIVVDIKDIKKQAHEKTLVETYEESTMFPLQVGQNTYYIHG